jgi:two-component system sensor histidine kinase BaeS
LNREVALRITVGHKLFLSVLLVSLIVIALIIGLTTWNLRQGFSTYLAQAELNRQGGLVKRLEDVYAARGNWALFKDDPAAWTSVIQADRVSDAVDPQARVERHAALDDWEASQQLAVLSSQQAPLIRAQFIQGDSRPPPTGRDLNQRPPASSSDPNYRPPQSAYDDCRGKNEGDEVWHRTRDGILRSTCLRSPEGLVARPNRTGQSQGRSGGSESGNLPNTTQRPSTPTQRPTPSASEPLASPPRPAAPPANSIAQPAPTTQSPPTQSPPGQAPPVQSPSAPSNPSQVIQAVPEKALVPEPETAEMVAARRYVLMDREGRYLAGMRAAANDTVVVRVLMNEQKVVGQLGLVVTAAASAMDRSFVDHSIEMVLIVAVLALVVSMLAALLLARHFTSILRQITLGTRRLASGEYTTRIVGERHDEFGDLVRDFNRLAHALEQHENNRRLWVAQTSHELRTPLSILRAHIEALIDEVRAPSRAEFEVLHKETLRLTKLVSDLNDLARADSGALAFKKEAVEVISLLDDSAKAFSDRFAAQRLTIERAYAGQALVFGDASRLRQLFANIFENVLRYTDAGGEVRLQVTIVGASVELCIEDSVPGVEATALASLFDPFFRTESSRQRETGGSGLGLAICKSIVMAHEGSIEAFASELGGLKLRLSFPLLEVNA